MKNSSDQHFKVAAIVVVIVCLITTLAYYYFWRAGFSSDTALAGLMAKSVLDRGERPIFYWQVGYQGTLEVYATALLFKVFGVGPRVLNLWQMLCFWLMLGLFYRDVRDTYDRWLAVLAVLFVAVSTPFMYVCVMRTQPNYTETFIMGILLLGLGRLLLRHYYLDARGTDKRALRLWALFGFIFGFAMYTYAQIIYFVGAIGVQLLLIMARELRLHWVWQGWRARVLGCALVPMISMLLVVAGHYLCDVPAITWFGWRVPTGEALKSTSIVAACTLTLWCCLAFPHLIRRLAPGAVVMATGFVLGWSPQIYYTWVLHGPARNRTALSGTLSTALQRWHWGLDGMREFMGIGIVPGFASVMIILTVVPLLVFAAHVAREAWHFVRTAGPRDMPLSGSSMVLLPAVALPLFSLSRAVEDLWSTRYLLVLWFWFAMASAYCVVWIWRHRGATARWACAVAVSVVLSHNAYNLAKRIIHDERHGFTGERAVAAMRQRGLKYGYAYYWAAYTVNFFTQEDIILQPISSAYCPYYGPLVAAAPRIAFLDSLSTFRDHLAMFANGRYRVADIWQDDELAMAVLERDDGGAVSEAGP